MANSSIRDQHVRFAFLIDLVPEVHVSSSCRIATNRQVVFEWQPNSIQMERAVTQTYAAYLETVRSLQGHAANSM